MTNTSSSFNLIDEPWIPVIMLDGTAQELSIKQVFEQAHEIRNLACELPTMDCAILRVLEAILYRAWLDSHLLGEDDALDLWESKYQNASILNADLANYLNTWYSRFNLIDDAAPFLQTPALSVAQDSAKPISALMTGIDDDALFSQRRNVASLTAAEAARELIHCYLYDCSGIKTGVKGDPRVKGGKAYPMGVGICGWYGHVIIHGKNFAETLLLNFVPYDEGEKDLGLPAWEDVIPPLGPHAPELKPTRVNVLTWPQRRILLFWNEGYADKVIITNGDAIQYTHLFGIESMTPWRYSNPQSIKAKELIYMPDDIKRGRSLMRSLNGIMPSDGGDQIDTKFGQQDPHKLSLTTMWLNKLLNERILSSDRFIRISKSSIAYGSQMASYDDIVSDSIELPLAVFESDRDDIRRVIREAMQTTEKVCNLLLNLSSNLYTIASGTQQSDDARVKLASAYYHTLSQPFAIWIHELSDKDTYTRNLLSWKQQVRHTALDMAKALMSKLAPNIWVIQRSNGNVSMSAIQAYGWFNSGLNKVIPPTHTSEERR